MTWNPTDKQGWKRALEGSTSLSAPEIPTKKVRSSLANSAEPVQVLKGDNNTNTNINAVQKDPAEGASNSCEPLDTGFAPLRSFFRSKSQRTSPGSDDTSTRGQTEPNDSSTAYAPAHTPGNDEVYNVLQSHRQCSKLTW
jgi:hypothetical protein